MLSQALPMGTEQMPMTSCFVGEVTRQTSEMIEIKLDNGLLAVDAKLVIACFLGDKVKQATELVTAQKVSPEKMRELVKEVPR